MATNIVAQHHFKSTDNGYAALAYAARGWFVFPCSKDKRPITAAGFKDATVDQDQIKRWWTEHPAALIGIPCEKSGFFALDIDTKNGVDGLASWADLLANNPETVIYGPSQRTPSGGWHHLFKLPRNIKVPNNAGKLGPGLDLRSNGYICTGPGYTWLENHGPETPLTNAPAWLLALISKMTEKPKQAAPTTPLASEQTNPGDYWLGHYLAEARPGNRNNAGWELACQMRDSRISEGEARQIMIQFAHQVPGDGYLEGEALASLKQAYAGSPREPANLPGAGHKNGNRPHPSESERVPDSTPETKGENKKIPDDGELANEWLDQAKLTAYGLGEWRRYSEGSWPADDDDIIGREILKIVEDAKPEGVRATSARVSSVKELARLKASIQNNLWDADQDTIICQNGAFHIPSKRLLPHSPDYRATFKVGYSYDPTATAEVWRFALSTTVPEAADFLQEFIGLCLTQDTRYEMALWLFGPLGSGKSTILEGIQTMLGERATLLGLADVERSRFALGNLRGKTLAVASEQPAIFMQATYILNAIISGEKITTERKFQDPIEFTPCVKVIWAMNELPRVPDAGNGLFRRVKVIKFPPLTEDQRDPEVKEAIKTEGAGILNWALEGLARLRARGRFDVPACVKDATSDFQRNNDVPALFVQECCIQGHEFRTQSQKLYDGYREWCLASGHKPMSSTSLASEWERLGFEGYKASGSKFWRGVGLIGKEEL